MLIQSNVTLDEEVEATMRLASRSEVVQSGRLNWSILVGTLTSLTVLAMMYFVYDVPFFYGCIISIGGAIIAGVFQWHVHPEMFKTRIRKYYQEQYGQRDSFPFQLELKEMGIRTEKLGTETIHQWSNVEEIKETEKAIDIYLHGGVSVFINKSKFASLEEQGRFIETAHQYWSKSRSSSRWLNAS